MTLILIGFMAAGKSTVARLLDRNAIDTDAVISSKFGMSTAEYFDKYGQIAFRQREEEVLTELAFIDGVISTGGGIVESHINQKLLSDQKQVVYLKADFETLVHRINNDTSIRRSLFESSTPKEFRKIYDYRVAIYEKLSKLTVDTTNKKPQEIATQILAHFY